MDVNTIKRIIFQLFPELTGKWHLPHFAKVIALPELPSSGQFSDEFYPRYAANVALLDESGLERDDVPIFQAVPLPVPGVGEHAGRLEPPAIGSIVEVAFAYGNPSKPFIRMVLGIGWHLPAIKAGESRYQQRMGVCKLVDEEGGFRDITDQLALLRCRIREVRADEEQDYRSPKSWFGSETENIFKLISELTEIVSNLSIACSSHTHPYARTDPAGSGKTSVSDKANTQSSYSKLATALKSRLDSITKL
ncbi:hypothetical protein [Candidatus Enterovibrio escicola]|uniref:Uncharacterized protein n=1 Tax=Candidatus Enterovibrio escicola TaxID=1927127 RepID=A0A2A5SZ48_9GAMM|nr:hypothetical protein [Candidatus Enterovibrio escacola]PCS21187.1 hypothetical protein BTN49_3238 [Candidatus Enterovibrio escacola]